MTYPSIEFLFFALFVCLIVSFIPKQFKIWSLLVSSFIWIASWKWSWALIYFLIALGNLALINQATQTLGKKRAWSFGSILLGNAVIFILLKVQLAHLPTPYGISFFMFMIMGVVFDKWRNESDFDKIKFTHFMLFPSFFAALMGGPISRGKKFFSNLESLEDWSFERTISGLMVFAYGFLKFFFLSKPLADLNSDLMFWSRDSYYTLLFMGLIGTLQAYIDFSSYCDMGRGVARVLGIDLDLNFRAIFFSINPNDFWQRWNITLGTWIRDYISFPVMLKFGRRFNQQLLLFLTFIIVGLWHGITWNWFLFGIFNGSIVVLYNQLNKWKSVPLLGRMFVWAIFIGNGLLQQKDFFLQIPSMLFRQHLSRTGYIHWDGLLTHFSPTMIIGLLVVFGFDFYQEKKKKVDWFTEINIFVKTLLVAFFLGWIIWSLSQNHFLEEVILPPVYFKI